jgi:hypothetical protein
MDQIAFFVDRTSRELTFSSASIEAVAFEICDEVLSGSARFNVSYNAFYLMAENIKAIGKQLNSPAFDVFADFIISAVLLQTNMLPTRQFSDEDYAKVEIYIGKERTEYYKKLLGTVKFRTNTLNLQYFPWIHQLFADAERSLATYVFGTDYRSPDAKFNGETMFLTFGSCFAQNIARYLTAAGMKVINFSSQEEASPMSFPDLIARLMTQDEFGPARAAIASSASVCVIFTAGVGEQYQMTSGDLVYPQQIASSPAKMRSVTASVPARGSDIVSGIEAGFASLGTLHDNITFVCTVSPVPLNSTIGTRLGVIPKSAVSKSALHLAIHELCVSDDERVYYFPSYEVVKDWAPLAGIQPFCADDGHPRHVSENLIGIICGQFLKRFCEATYFERINGQQQIPVERPDLPPA